MEKTQPTNLFTKNELDVIEANIAVLRACPAIPFALANNINANHAPVKKVIKQIQEKINLVRERGQALEAEKDTDLDKFKAGMNELSKNLTEIFNESHKVQLVTVSLSEFAGIDINGDKEVKQQDGTVLKFSYRDAYFTLVEAGLIV